jgi:photosystem II protein PsbQ|tara:strand:+ start:184 stop:633 length:450 start_codon:yes stop_codon:yes gene_type:complete
MLNALRRFAAFCLCIALSLGVIAPAESHADTAKPEDMAVIRRQAEAFMSAEKRLPELAKLVSDENWVFTRNLIHGPLQEVGREMLYINQRLNRSERKQADKLARSLKTALAELDEASRLQDPARMQRAYSAVAAGFDAYSEVIPAEALS